MFSFIDRETQAWRSNPIQRTWLLGAEQALGRLLRAHPAMLPFQRCASFSQTEEWGLGGHGTSLEGYSQCGQGLSHENELNVLSSGLAKSQGGP